MNTKHLSSNSPRVLVQERLRDCRAGELTQTLQPILLGTAAIFGKVGAKTFTKAEGSKTAEGTQNGHTQAVLRPSRSAEAGFLALTHLPPNAHAGTSAGHR